MILFKQGVAFLCEKKILARLKKQNTTFALTYFVTKIDCPFHSMYLLLLIEDKEVCLSINCAQSVRLEKGKTEFKKLF